MDAGGRDMDTIIKYIRHYRGYSVANRLSDLLIYTAPPSRPSVTFRLSPCLEPATLSACPQKQLEPTTYGS